MLKCPLCGSDEGPTRCEDGGPGFIKKEMEWQQPVGASRMQAWCSNPECGALINDESSVIIGRYYIRKIIDKNHRNPLRYIIEIEDKDKRIPEEIAYVEDIIKALDDWFNKAYHFRPDRPIWETWK